MSIQNVAYGLTNALQQLAPQPILAQRDPVGTDRAEVGTIWVNLVAQTFFVNCGTVGNVTTWVAG